MRAQLRAIYDEMGELLPGCGGGVGNQGCAIARCSITRDGFEYCFECFDFPCKKYDNITQYDSFIVHRHQMLDLGKAQTMGIEAYNAEQLEKIKILDHLLENYNAGRQKTLFHLAVNLFTLKDLQMVMKKLCTNSATQSLTIKDKAAYAVHQFQVLADKRGTLLKLIKKQ